MSLVSDIDASPVKADCDGERAKLPAVIEAAHGAFEREGMDLC